MRSYKNFDTDMMSYNIDYNETSSSIPIPEKYNDTNYGIAELYVKHYTNRVLQVENNFYRFVLHYTRYFNNPVETIETRITIILNKYNENKLRTV